MNQDNSLLASSSETNWSFEKATPFPTSNACYRSRIYTSNISVNPLIAACDQILSMATILATAEYPDNSDKFLQDLAHEIRSFEHRTQIVNYPSNMIIAARYVLCALLDEIITQTSWGQKHNWSQKNLLSLFHHENCGDIRFFNIIDRALENTTTNLHLIELLYTCLTLGFLGKYKDPLYDKSELNTITNKLQQIVVQHNDTNSKDLLVKDENTASKQTNVPKPKSKIKTKYFFLATTTFALIVSAAIYTSININLNKNSKSAHSIIEQIIKGESQL